MSSQVRDWILQRIGSGELAPGDRVVETQVAQALRVSPIPVREAIRELVAMRVLEFAPNKGSWVRQVSIEETVEALQVRSAMEPLALKLAAPNLRGRSQELRRIVKALIASARKRDLTAFQRENQNFHRGIVEAAGNRVLLRLWDELAYEVGAHQIMELLPPSNQVVVAREHETILNALEAGHPDHAAQLLASHTQHLIDALRNKIAVRDGRQDGEPSTNGCK